MNRKTIIIVAISAIVIIAVLLIYFLAVRPFISDRQVRIKDKIHLLKEETIPLRFKIVSHANGEMVMMGKFYNLDGKSVGRFETPFDNDGPIGLVFLDVDIDGSHLMFPYSIYMSEGLQEIPLRSFYGEDGFPHVYDSDLADTLLKAEIGKIFRLLDDNGLSDVVQRYGPVYNLNVCIDHPREGVNYEVKTTSSGKAFFVN